MRTAAPLLLALLAACAPAGPRPDGPGPTRASLEVVCALDVMSPDPIEGEIGLFVIQLRNASKDRVVVLKDVAGPDGAPVISWSAASQRALRYDAAKDEYVPAADPKPGPVEPLNVGVLLPGETIQFRPRIRFIGFPKRFAVRHFDYSREEAAQNLYWEQREAGGRVRYRRISAVDVEEKLLSSRSVEGTHRSVVFPHGDSILEQPRSADLRLDQDVRPRAFRLADAAAKAKVDPAAVTEATWSTYLEGWALRTAAGSWLATPRGAVPLPPISSLEAFFQHLDLIEPGVALQVEFLGFSDARFPEVRIVLQHDVGGTRRIGFIPREGALAFLAKVRAEDGEIDLRASPGRTSVRVRRRSYQLAEALARVGVARAAVVEAHYSTWLGGWALRTEKESWFAGSAELVKLPPITRFGLFFQSLDVLDPARPVELDYSVAARAALPPEGPATRERLPALLGRIRERGFTVEVRLESERMRALVR